MAGLGDQIILGIDQSAAMNIIEQAAKRLEELQRAGGEVPWMTASPQAPVPGPSIRAEPEPGRDAASVQTLRADGSLGRVHEPKPDESRPPAPVANRAQRSLHSVELDLRHLADLGYVVPGAPRSATADEFRLIKRPLLKNATLRGEAALRRGNLIQVASAKPGEGKTFTSINLALSLAAELDHSVLLVDADVVRPAVLPRLGLQSDRGLLDVLRDPTLSLADVILPTNVPKLSLLPAGHASVDSTELLASAAMEALLDEMAARYSDRIVIFDSPPLLAATESRVLATRMGQVLVVVESGITPKDVIAEAFAAVANCPVVMAVLNKYSGPPLTGPYGY